MFGLQLGRLGIAGSLFNESALWPLGEASPGMWIDPPYTASLFSTSAGTTAISAIGTVLDTSNPVGLALDRKGGLALGPELVVNGDFATDTAWTKGVGWSISGGVGSRVADASVTSLSQSAVFPQKGWYLVSINVVSISGGEFQLRDGATANILTSIITPGIRTLYWYCAAAGSLTCVARSNAVVSVDNISVKEIPGIHLSQATSPARPVASARKNELLATTVLPTQNVTVTAVQRVLSFTGTGTVTLSGVSTAGPLIGTGAADRVSLTFTPTAGTLTLTVSGSVTLAQLETAA